MKINSYNNFRLKDLSDEAMAHVLWNLFLREYESAIREECRLEAELTSYREANARYRESTKDDDSFCSLGRRDSIYSESDITRATNAVTNSQRDTEECKAMLEFLKNKLLRGINLDKSKSENKV